MSAPETNPPHSPRSPRERAIDWLARSLGIEATPTPLDWFVRLFFQPPAPGKPDYARRWIRAAVLYFALQWGVLEPHRLRAWCWRAFVRAPR
jgi:cellulose synthase (UDP-forming)